MGNAENAERALRAAAVPPQEPIVVGTPTELDPTGAAQLQEPRPSSGTLLEPPSTPELPPSLFVPRSFLCSALHTPTCPRSLHSAHRHKPSFSPSPAWVQPGSVPAPQRRAGQVQPALPPLQGVRENELKRL